MCHPDYKFTWCPRTFGEYCRLKGLCSEKILFLIRVCGALTLNLSLILGDLLCDIKDTYNFLLVIYLSDFKQNGRLFK